MKFTQIQIATKTLALKLLALLSLILVSQTGYACDRSSIVLDSLVSDGVNFELYITQNVGGGITGSSRGADNSTFTFAYSFYGQPSLNISYFPPSITSTVTQVTNNGLNVGPFHASNFTIGYLSPGQAYTCVSSTAGCGNVHTDVKQLHFTLNEIPDSIRLFGIEGAGNPIAGCYPDPDMVIIFGTLPVVWSDFYGVSANNEVDLTYATAEEVNTDHFSIQRSVDGFIFEEIGIQEAAGNSDQVTTYTFTDERPLEGTAFYKIVQFDQDGRSSSTETILVTTELNLNLAWTSIGPNPVVDVTQVNFTSSNDQKTALEVVDMNGRVISHKNIDAFRGNNRYQLDMNNIPSGSYIIRLSNREGALTKLITRL